MNEYTTKRPCSKCGNVYPMTTEFFYADKQKPNGLRPDCKACNNAKKQTWRIHNPELVKQNSKLERERIKANPEKADRRKALSRNHYWRNADKKRAKWREYYQREKEYHLERSKQWRINNPEKAKALWKRSGLKNNSVKRAIRAAREKSVANNFTRSDWQYALEYFNGCCAVCGRQAKDLFGERTIAADHWQPISKGGGTTPDNIVPLCHGVDGCNNTKSNKLPEQWLIEKYGKSKAAKIILRISNFFKTVRKL